MKIKQIEHLEDILPGDLMTYSDRSIAGLAKVDGVNERTIGFSFPVDSGRTPYMFFAIRGGDIDSLMLYRRSEAGEVTILVGKNYSQ